MDIVVWWNDERASSTRVPRAASPSMLGVGVEPP